MTSPDFQRFERATGFTKTKHGLLAHLDDELLRIDVLGSNVVRIKISRGGVFDEKPSFALAHEPELARRGFKVKDSRGSTTLVTSDLRVTVHHAPFAIDIHRTDGSVVFESVVDPEGAWSYGFNESGFVIRRRIGADDFIYGLGEKTGSFNRRGRKFTMWNTDVLNPTASGEFTAQYDKADPRADNTSTEFDPYYMSIPFFYHQDDKTLAMSGSFIDNPYRGHYDFEPKDEYQIRFDGGQYTEYVFGGPVMGEILTQYAELTGRMELPPLWALGMHQCRWYGYNQNDVERIVAKFKEVDVPLDAFWLDIDYMDGYRVFTWNKERYPDATGMLERLRAQGVKVITIIDPGVKEDPGYEVYDDGLEKQIFAITEKGDTYIGQVWPGDTAFPDFANEDARKWWGELNAEHVKSGLAGIWNDMNEPATGDKDPLPMRFDHGKYEHERFHNQYATLMAMGTVEGLRKAMPNLRTFVLSRAGSPGIQRYAANWMGDNMSRWDHLHLSIAMGNGLSVSGQPFIGADIGGFAEDTNAELFTRWVQYGVLTPFARVHSVINTIDQYPWSFGEEVLDRVRNAWKLRYRLLPYIYSCFAYAHESGFPIQSPLHLIWQGDRTAKTIDDQFLLGPNIMVAPIYEPEQTARQVYLPEGTWFDFHTEEQITSNGMWIRAEAPLERIPIYVYGGSVIAMLPEAPQNTDKLAPKKIQLHIYVPNEDVQLESALFEDDGLTFKAQEGDCLITNFKFGRYGKKMLLEVRTEGNGFAEFAREEFELVWHSKFGVESHTIANTGGSFTIFIEEHEEGLSRVQVDIKESKRKRKG